MTDMTTQPAPKREDPLDKMSLPALELLRDKVDRAISAHHHRLRLQETEAERAEIEAQAREGRPKAEPQPRAPRHPRPSQGYRHPDDPSITWPGLDRRPAWLHAALERGIQLEDLAIPAGGLRFPGAQAVLACEKRDLISCGKEIEHGSGDPALWLRDPFHGGRPCPPEPPASPEARDLRRDLDGRPADL